MLVLILVLFCFQVLLVCKLFAFNYISTNSDTLKYLSSGAKGRERYPSHVIIQIEFIKI